MDTTEPTGKCDGCEDTVPVAELTEVQSGFWPLRFCGPCYDGAYGPIPTTQD